MNITIKRVSRMPFTYTSRVRVEESTPRRAIISGTLLSEGVSRNGRVYTLETLEDVASQAPDTPLYYGTETRRDDRGVLMANMHTKGDLPVGKILRAWIDKIARKVYFTAEIVNESLIKAVRKGWHISIGGTGKASYSIEKNTNRILAVIKDMILTHVQLFEPSKPAGFADTEVSNVVEESMVFGKDITVKEIAAVLATLRHKGVI